MKKMSVLLFACAFASGVFAAERIITVDAGSTTMVRALGLGEQIIAIDVTSQQAQANKLPVIGYHRQLAAENLLALKPSVLIGTEHMGPEPTLTALKQAGVTIVSMPAPTEGAQLLGMIEQLASALPEADTSLLTAQVREQLASIAEQKLPPATRAVFLFDGGNRGLRIGGTGTGGDALIRLLGASNIATTAAYQATSLEAILALDADLILISTEADESLADVLKKHPLLAESRAAKQQKLLPVNGEALVAGLSVTTLPEAQRLLQQLNQQDNTAP